MRRLVRHLADAAQFWAVVALIAGWIALVAYLAPGGPSPPRPWAPGVVLDG